MYCQGAGANVLDAARSHSHLTVISLITPKLESIRSALEILTHLKQRLHDSSRLSYPHPPKQQRSVFQAISILNEPSNERMVNVLTQSR